MEIMVLLGKVLVFWVISMIIATMVHEMGHVVMGLLQGWKFYYLVIGPMRIYREDLNDRIHIGYEKNSALWGGVGATLPKTKEDAKLSIFGKILLAGPLASMILGVIAGVLGFVFHSVFFLLLMGCAIGMGGACMIPGVKTGLLYNDGSRFYRSRQGGQAQAEEEIVFHEAFRSYFEETKTPMKDIETLRNSKDVEFRYLAECYAYENARQDGNEEEMKAIAEVMKNMKGVPAGVRNMSPEAM